MRAPAGACIAASFYTETGMPCPYFDPQRVAASAAGQARLPLIDEYDGFCRAASSPVAVPIEMRFACCNQGNSRGVCVHFPAGEQRSALRYQIIQRSRESFDLIALEERDYTPLAWRQVRYFLLSDRFEPEPADLCQRAQMRAFCRSYLARFPESHA
jgi:hypothetical protein